MAERAVVSDGEGRPQPPGAPEHHAAARPSRSRSALVLAGFMLLIGMLHFVAPKPFERIVPHVLGNHRFWVYASGLAEITCAGLLANPRTRRYGGYLTAATMVAVYPANIQMAVDVGMPHKAVDWFPWIRLPFQFPMIAFALRQTKP